MRVRRRAVAVPEVLPLARPPEHDVRGTCFVHLDDGIRLSARSTAGKPDVPTTLLRRCTVLRAYGDRRSVRYDGQTASFRHLYVALPCQCSP
jgi:hypothetical protein